MRKQTRVPNRQQSFVLLHVRRDKWDEFSAFILQSPHLTLDCTGYWHHYGGELHELPSQRRLRRRWIVPPWNPPLLPENFEEGLQDWVLDDRTRRYIADTTNPIKERAFAFHNPLQGKMYVAFPPETPYDALVDYLISKGYPVETNTEYE